MGGISLSVHPLFYIFGLYYALTGRIFVFVIYTITAVAHELGHSFSAAGAGYRLNKITLMPFGAVVSGNIDGLKFSDEIKIALSGPTLNLLIGMLFVATWWIYPESYAYTDVVAEANFAMALINFLPVFPLDGGRILSAYLSGKFGEKRAGKICGVIGGMVAGVLFALFILTLFYTVNVSLLFFSLFVIFGTFGKAKNNKYIKIYNSLTVEKLKRGMPFKKQALEKNASVKKMMSILDENAVNEIAVFDGERQIALLSQERIGKIIEKGNLYAKLAEYL
ncbi:MAG: hypothetical protein IKA11_00495 [Clostridia bacterium]|nr:hypothetical protein [Clostridia bacterium]